MRADGRSGGCRRGGGVWATHGRGSAWAMSSDRPALRAACIFLRSSGCTGTALRQAGWTPLMIAVSAGHLDASRTLLAAGASARAANENGQTALHYAASRNRTPVRCRARPVTRGRNADAAAGVRVVSGVRVGGGEDTSWPNCCWSTRPWWMLRTTPGRRRCTGMGTCVYLSDRVEPHGVELCASARARACALACQGRVAGSRQRRQGVAGRRR